MADSQPPVFYIGLNMPGAVSAGAYTAGVVDFLIDALDTWYAERERQKAKYGNNYDQWEIPAHEIRLAVMTGASAGGMTSAIAGAALCEPFQPVRSVGSASTNRLYQSWVTDIDIKYLLANDDIAAPGSVVHSFLNSSRIDTIAQNALQVTNPLPQPRAYVAEPLRITLTVSNLKGIPYAIEDNAGSAETQTLYYADQQSFQISWSGAPGTDGALSLNPHKLDGWQMLQDVAKATGAFPFALKARQLIRTTKQYKDRLWRLPVENPASQNCQCEELRTLDPAFGDVPDESFTTLNVDGGVTDNDPFACAYNALSLADPAHPIGRPPTSALDTDRAVISIAPFLSAPDFKLGEPVDSSLLGILPQLVNAVLNQSRMSGESLQLTRNPEVYSAFHVSPSIDDRTINALASASLSAFGGFVNQAFRDHDYQLGRRNCQWFLQQYFGVPLDNVVMRNYVPQSEQARNALLANFGVKLPSGDGVMLIPLLGELQEEVTVERIAIPQTVLPPLAGQAAARLKLIIARLMEQYGADFLAKTGFDAAWMIFEGKVKNAVLEFAGKGLAREKLLD